MPLPFLNWQLNYLINIERNKFAQPYFNFKNLNIM
jgi:hypothetical protein